MAVALKVDPKFRCDRRGPSRFPCSTGVHAMFRRILPLLTFTTPLLFAGTAPAEEPVKLRFKMKKGDKLIYRSSSKVKKTESVNGMKVKTAIDSNTISVRTFKGLDKKGNLKLDAVVKKVKMTAEIGPLGKYTYDSTSTDNEKSSQLGQMFTPALDTIVEASINVSITPTGQVLPVKGYKELLAEAVKDSPLKSQYSNEAYRVEFGESLVRLPEKAVKKGDTWQHKYTQKLPGVGTMKGSTKFEHAGYEKVGKRQCVKITATHEGTFEIALKRMGADISGTLTMSKATSTIYFDAKAGQVVKKSKTASMTGTLNIDVNGMQIGVENDQTTTQQYELLDKMPK